MASGGGLISRFAAYCKPKAQSSKLSFWAMRSTSYHKLEALEAGLGI